LARTLKEKGHTAAERVCSKDWEVIMIVVGKVGQSVLAMVAAAVLTVTAVSAAVAPARALETAPVTLAANTISGQALA
jgi:hypothetical protein